MQLVPLVRSLRIISALTIMPENPIEAMALSETISVFGPLLNAKLRSKIIGSLIYKINIQLR